MLAPTKSCRTSIFLDKTGGINKQAILILKIHTQKERDRREEKDGF